MKKRKNKSSVPRHKRLKKSSRLQAAKCWIAKYNGENLVKGYSKYFAVDKLCAVKELRGLGYEINEEYAEQLKCSIEMQRQLNQKRIVIKEEKELSEIEEFFEEDLEIHMIGKIEKFDNSYDELPF